MRSSARLVDLQLQPELKAAVAGGRAPSVFTKKGAGALAPAPVTDMITPLIRIPADA